MIRSRGGLDNDSLFFACCCIVTVTSTREITARELPSSMYKTGFEAVLCSAGNKYLLCLLAARFASLLVRHVQSNLAVDEAV